MASNKLPAVSKKGLPTLSTNLTVRMTPEYRQWLERAALHCRMTVSAFLDSPPSPMRNSMGSMSQPPSAKETSHDVLS